MPSFFVLFLWRKLVKIGPLKPLGLPLLKKRSKTISGLVVI